MTRQKKEMSGPHDALDLFTHHVSPVNDANAADCVSRELGSHLVGFSKAQEI